VIASKDGAATRVFPAKKSPLSPKAVFKHKRFQGVGFGIKHSSVANDVMGVNWHFDLAVFTSQGDNISQPQSGTISKR
jgi:hypothetical protein